MSTSRSPVFLSRVNDLRRDQKRIGCKKSGFSTESADLFLDHPIPQWFGGVLNEEFKRAGLTLAKPETPGVCRIEVNILDFFIEPEVGFAYELHAVVHAELLVYFANNMPDVLLPIPMIPSPF
jgi:hypothetical protein